MKYQIGILDKDVSYCRYLMEFINMNKASIMHSVCFTSEETLLDYFTVESLDLLLCGKGEASETFHQDGCIVVRLAEVDKEEYVGERYVYKYQRVDMLVERLLSILELSVDKPVHDVLLYGVYSPIGRSGKTSFSFGICNSFCDALYIGLDSYIGSISVDSFGFEQSEKFYYQFLTHNEEIVSTIQEIRCSQGLNYVVVYGLRNYADYRQITHEDISWFRELLSRTDSVKRVVFDVEAAVLSELTILREFDHVYVPVLTDAYAGRRLEHFKLLMQEDEYENLRKQICYIEVPRTPYNSDVMSEFVRRNVR